jgi:hypothetical protein
MQSYTNTKTLDSYPLADASRVTNNLSPLIPSNLNEANEVFSSWDEKSTRETFYAAKIKDKVTEYAALASE